MKPLSLRTLSRVTGAGLTLMCGATQAATLSFASDDDSSAFTLIGTAGTGGAGGTFGITNGRDPAFTPVTLRIDDDNMANPTVSLPVGLRVNLTASYIASQPVGAAQNHVYGVSGQYSFVNPNNNAELLRVNIVPGAGTLNVLGSSNSWGSAGSMFGSDAAFGFLFGVDWSTSSDLVSYAQSQGINPSLYGLDAFGFVNEDFAFTMTNLNAGAGVAIDPTSKLPSAAWGSEASHSSHATSVPAPGAAAVLGLAGLGVSLRRRRTTT